MFNFRGVHSNVTDKQNLEIVIGSMPMIVPDVLGVTELGSVIECVDDC